MKLKPTDPVKPVTSIDPAILYRQEFKYFLRMAFEVFHPNEPPLRLTWSVKAMVYAAEQTVRGDCRRLAVNVPPRYGKSITFAIALTAWLLGIKPDVKILVATYSDKLAIQHDRMVLKLMQSAPYKRAFPDTVIDQKATKKLDIHTTAGGYRMAVTTGGSATGFGGDYIVLDDCMKAIDAGSEAERTKLLEWYRGTVGTRLNNKNKGVIVSIQQRLHEDDLTAFFLEGGATHLNLPAIAVKRELIPIGPGQFHERLPGDVLDPEREGLDTLNQMRRQFGSRMFETQYQQNPTPDDGNIVRPEWFPRYEERPDREEFRMVGQSWDTAWSDEPSASYTVCTTWGYKDRLLYLLDVFRKRVPFHDLRGQIILLRRQWSADVVLIEDAASGKALWPDFLSRGPFRPIMCAPPTVSKEERLIAQTGWMESGDIVLPQEAPWLEAYLHELKAAPNCRHWDQIDSTTQFLEYATWRRSSLDREIDPRTGRYKSPYRPSRPLSSEPRSGGRLR